MKKLLQRLFAPRRGARSRSARCRQRSQGAAGRSPGAVGSLRCRHDHLSVRDDPPASRELSMAHGQVRPGDRRFAAAGGRNHRRRQEPDEADGGDGQPRLLAQACRRSPTRVPPAKRAALAAAIKQERLSAAGVRPDGDLGRGLHPARQPVQGHGPEGRRRRRRRASQRPSPAQGKPIGELETNLEQLGFFDKLPEKRAARSCSKARSTTRRT